MEIEDNSWRIEAYDSVPSKDLFDRESDKPIRNTKLFTFANPSTGGNPIQSPPGLGDLGGYASDILYFQSTCKARSITWVN